MAKKAEPPIVADPLEEKRAPDQEGAIEVAFVEGTLPEEDRRCTKEPEPVPEEPAVEEVVIVEEVIRTPMELAADAQPIVLDAGGVTVGDDAMQANEVSNALASYLMLSNGGIGTTLERQSHGWKLKFVDGGTVLQNEGVTIANAMGLA